ncbi:MAG: YARHG domain-containing protein [Lachnospiraceae bacterium]|nr:YARHG domain-containing protein [Lachnospiraceae bacterium]
MQSMTGMTFICMRQTKAELRIARNEIYARYGWWFESEDLVDYFAGKAWYAASVYIDDIAFSDVERANIDLISEMEETAPVREDIMLESDMDIEGGTALTAMELGEISGFLCAMDAYGFLQSFYQDVRDVDVEAVLYGGAGILDGEFTESVRNSYLEAVGKSEFDTDFIALRESDIDALLKRRTGYGLSDMRTPLSWTYLKEEQAYCMEAGDTNYMEVAVIDGMKTDDGMYYILYENPLLEYTDEDTTCIVTLKKQGDEYQFISNARQ